MEIIDPAYFRKKAKYITIGIIYVIFAFWMLLNGEAFLGYWNPSWTPSIIIYLLGVVAFLGYAEKLPVDLKKPVSDSIFGFLIAFPLFTVVFFAIAQSGLYFQGIEPLLPYMIIPTIIFQVGIVASSEEIIFRGVIFRLFHKINPYLGYLGSSVLFAVFHWAAYGGSYPAMLTAFSMGIIMCLLTKYFNIGVSISFHAAFNCFVLGATAIIYLTA